MRTLLEHWKIILLIFTAVVLLCLFVYHFIGQQTRFSIKGSTYQTSDSTSSVTILFGGDIMCQRRQQQAAFLPNGTGYDFNYAFDYVKDIIQSADFSIANLETNISPSHPLSIDQRKKYEKPYLNAPASFLTAVKNAGFNVLVSANNHNSDTGVDGLLETISNIDATGFTRTGIYKNATEKRYIILEKNNIKVGLASYVTYLNPSKQDFSKKERAIHLNEYSQSKVKKDIKKMKKEGAEYILIYFHSGIEFTNSSSPKQQRIAKEIANAGADYILCSHSHTVQEYDIITGSKGKQVPVIYGMGNFISHMTKRIEVSYGIMMSLTLTKENGQVRLSNEGYYPLRVFTNNEDTGRKYQLIPCTDSGIAAISDEAMVRRLKSGRKRIKKYVGSNIKMLR